MSCLTLLKFSLPDCPACQRMAEYDRSVAEAEGLDFINVDVRDAEAYKEYREILLQRFPLKREIKYPTYLLVEDLKGDFTIHGEMIGSSPKEEFAAQLSRLRNQSDN